MEYFSFALRYAYYQKNGAVSASQAYTRLTCNPLIVDQLYGLCAMGESIRSFVPPAVTTTVLLGTILKQVASTTK